ncbi:MAG: hypothetical protein ACYC6N_00810 [Pirellulaceae bacterium]
MQIGFSTGSLAFADFRKGLKMSQRKRVRAVELSALREQELDPLLTALDSLEEDLTKFDYVSFHAPSKLEKVTERYLTDVLRTIANRHWSIIVHPDIIQDFALWRRLGSAVCIENMDKRKSKGRTAAQLRQFFEKLPEATFCFDIGHARQVDPTMQEAKLLLQSFGDRLRQVHMSYVNSQSGHERLNFESRVAFRRVTSWINESVPVILETPVVPETIDDEVATARSLFAANMQAQRRAWRRSRDRLPDKSLPKSDNSCWQL